MHAGHEQGQPEGRVGHDFAQQGDQEAVVRTTPRDDGDGPHAIMSSVNRVPAGISRLTTRPRSCDLIAGDKPVPGRFTASISWVSSLPAGMCRAATRLLRATAAISASLGTGSLRPLPSAPSTVRIPVTN